MRVTSFDAEDQDLQYRIDIFMANSKIGTLLNRFGMLLTVGVTPNEFAEMNNRVTAAELSTSRYLSDCVFQRAIPKTKRLNHVNSPIFERAIDQIRRIRNNNHISLIS